MTRSHAWSDEAAATPSESDQYERDVYGEDAARTRAMTTRGKGHWPGPGRLEGRRPQGQIDMYGAVSATPARISPVPGRVRHACGMRLRFCRNRRASSSPDGPAGTLLPCPITSRGSSTYRSMWTSGRSESVLPIELREHRGARTPQIVERHSIDEQPPFERIGQPNAAHHDVPIRERWIELPIEPHA